MRQVASFFLGVLGILYWILKVLIKTVFWVVVILMLFGLLTAAALGYWGYRVVQEYSDELPDISQSDLFRLQQTSFITDRSGEEVLYELIGDEDRVPLELEQINPYLVAAVLATEDSKYWQHTGYDLSGILMAACHEAGSLLEIAPLRNSCPPRGGSTITQQLIKNIILTRERSYERKIKEILLAYKMETSYSKEAILEMYLNSVSFGSFLYGVEAASQGYFQKSAAELSLAESSILAALIQRPGALSPWGGLTRSRLTPEGQELLNSEGVDIIQILEGEGSLWDQGLVAALPDDQNPNLPYLPGRTDHVLRRMLETGEISYREKRQALDELQGVEFQRFQVDILHPHYVMTAREVLPTLVPAHIIAEGGLTIETALDLTLQRKAETLVSEHVLDIGATHGANNAAAVILHPQTGEVYSMVGSRDFWDESIDGQVNVATSQRQAGSTVKPFVYALGIFSGNITPQSILNDVATRFEDGWAPQNADGQFRGRVTVGQALAESRNIPAVLVSKMVGYHSLYDFLAKLGVSFQREPDYYGHPLSLGTAEMSPVEVAGLYASLANGGQQIQPVYIRRVLDRNDQVIYEATPQLEPRYPPEVAQSITSMLNNQNLRPRFWNSTLQIDDLKIAVKTGTSNKVYGQALRPGDAWTAGYTENIVVTVWTGNTDGSPLSAEGFGLYAAAPLWRSLFLMLLEESIPAQ